MFVNIMFTNIKIVVYSLYRKRAKTQTGGGVYGTICGPRTGNQDA